MLLADGTTVPIEQIEIGDEVWTTEGETGESSPQPVTDLIIGTGVKHLVDVVAGGQRIVATAGHPFWTADDGWTDAGDLQAGDQLRHPDGSTTVIEQVRHHADPDATVHNLTVDTTHTYYIGHHNGDTTLLVHNCKVHGNSKKSKRPTAVYQIRNSRGEIVKIGQSSSRYSPRGARAGQSPRANAQARRWTRQSGGNDQYRAEIVRWYPNKQQALARERLRIRAFERARGRLPAQNRGYT